MVVVCASRGATARPTRDDVAGDVDGLVELDERVPFAVVDLAAALRARLEPGAQPMRVVVRMVADDRVEVKVAGRTRELALEGRRGSSAARLVALAAVDLMVPELAALPGTVAVHPDESPAPATPPTTAPTSISMLGAAARWSGVLAGGVVDLAVPRGAWSVAGELGGGTLVTGDLHLSGAIARLGLAVRPSVLELRIGVTLAPIVTRDGVGDLTVLLGGGASARLRLPIGATLHAVLAAGVDVFATRTEYLRAGMTTVATPWLAPWVAAGVEVSL